MGRTRFFVRTSIAGALIFGAPALAAPRVAAAGDEADLDQLRKRFREGIALEDKEEWGEAYAIFDEIAKKKMSPQVRFHLALCDAHTGRLLEARKGFADAQALAESDPSNAKDVIENAPARLREVEARIPHLLLEVAGGGEADVVLDGNDLGTVKRRIDVPVEPGSHKIGLRLADGDEKPLKTVSVAEREKLALEIPAKKREERIIVRDGHEERPRETPPPDVVHGTKVPFFVVGSVGLASLVVSGVMIGLRQAAIAEVRDSCTGSGPDTGCDPALADVADRGHQYELAAWGLGVGGVACLGIATVLFFTIGQDTAAQNGAPSKPAPASHGIRTIGLATFGAGLLLNGSFD